MTNIEKARQDFEEALKIKEQYAAEDKQLLSRIRNSENNIISLQKEADELKSKRPAMLAEEEDVTTLNQRLKNIQEEIELNQDTIAALSPLVCSSTVLKSYCLYVQVAIPFATSEV